MCFGLENSGRTLAVTVIWLLVVCSIKGFNALSGLARLSGPLRGCQAVAFFNNTVAANRTTDGNGSFNVSVGKLPDDVVRVVVNPGTSCIDTFTTLTLPFQLAAALPANATAGSVGYGSFMGLSYLELNNTSAKGSSSGSIRPLSNITTVRQTMANLYGAFNISIVPYGLDPLQLQPLTLVQSANATSRALAVALLSADVEMGALAALGAALLNASAPAAANGTAVNGTAAASAANMTTYARAVALEGAFKLEAARQALLDEAEEAAAAAAAADAITLLAAAAGNSTVVDNPPSPPSPPPPPSPPSAAAVGGLYSADVVAEILVAAAARTNVSVLPYAVNATAAVVAGMASFAEVVKEVALLEVWGLQVGLNPLNALITLTRLAAVQADAAAQMPALVGPNPAALSTYVLDALPERLSKASANLTAIHAFLGLPPPPAAVPAAGAAHVVGPLAGCSGQYNGVWDPAYEAFVSTTGSAVAGALSLSAKGMGLVAVTPYRACMDAVTTLQLSMSVTNLGPAMAAVSVSPVAMLAQSLYTLNASRQLATITLVQQTAAFAAMGLNLTAYNQMMILPPNSTASSSSSSSANGASSSAATTNVTSSQQQVFNLSAPLMGSVMAANAQLVGLIYASRALFATSCKYAYDMDGAENANTFTATLTFYAAARQADAAAGGLLNLTSSSQLESIFAFVAAACYFNSTAEFSSGGADGSATATPTGSTRTGTFLSGGSAAAVGASLHTVSAGHRRHHSRRRSVLAALRAAETGFRLEAEAVGVAASPLLPPALHRRLHAGLVAAGVIGPEALLRRRLWLGNTDLNRDLDLRLPPDLESEIENPGQGAGHEARAAELAAGRAAGQPLRHDRSRSRSLAVYVDDPDIIIVYTKVAEVLSGINARLAAVQATSTAAAAGLPPPTTSNSSSSSSSSYNLTDLVATAAELGYVVQKSLYNELGTALGGTYSSGLTLVVAVQAIAARYTGAALNQRMAEAAIDRTFICSAEGAQCASSPAPSPSPSGGGGSGGGKKSSTMLYAGIGVGVGLGVVALLLAAWLVRRAVQKRQVKQAVVNNFKSGDMHSMALRLPSTLPLDGPMYGGGGGARQSQPPDVYHSLVPAALGSDPTVALDYPLYPVPNLNPTASAYYHQQHQQQYNNASLRAAASTGAGPAAGGGFSKGGGGNGQLNASLPPPRFPPPPPADRGSTVSQGPAASVPLPQQQQPLRTAPNTGVGANGGGGYKTYANSAYVPVDGGGGGSDAAAPRDNHLGAGGSADSNGSSRRLLGSTPQQYQQQQQQQQRPPHIEGAGLPPMTPPPPAATAGPYGKGSRISEVGPAGAAGSGRQMYPNASLGSPLRSGAPSGLFGAGDSAAQLLNGTLGGGTRRSGLPPLAQYTSVTNTAAPTAALNASMRTIPVNANFNSSLRRPLPSYGSASQPGRQTER